MSDPLTDAANAINSASVNIRKFAQLAAARIEAVEARVAKLEGGTPPPPPPPPPPPVSGLRVGVIGNVAGWGTPMQQHVLDLGAKLIREDRGDYAIPWAKSHGIDVIQLFAKGDLTPYSPDAYAYELDNEPYNGNTWIGGDYATWARQMLASAKALRAKTSKPIIVPFAQPWNNGDVNGVDGIKLLNQTVPELFTILNGLAIHPYSQPYDWKLRLPVLDKWRTNLKAIGHDLPFWITECGWPTGGTTWTPAQTETQQATYLGSSIDTMRARGDVAVYMVYDVQDFGPRDTDSEHWFGILRADGSQKPAYAAVKQRL